MHLFSIFLFEQVILCCYDFTVLQLLLVQERISNIPLYQMPGVQFCFCCVKRLIISYVLTCVKLCSNLCFFYNTYNICNGIGLQPHEVVPDEHASIVIVFSLPQRNTVQRTTLRISLRFLMGHPTWITEAFTEGQDWIGKYRINKISGYDSSSREWNILGTWCIDNFLDVICWT